MLGAAPSGSRHFVATPGGSLGVTGFASGTKPTRHMPPTALPMGGILQLEFPIRHCLRRCGTTDDGHGHGQTTATDALTQMNLLL